MIKYDKNHIPTAYERFVFIINALHPYFKILKSVLTILSPSNNFQSIIIYSTHTHLVC